MTVAAVTRMTETVSFCDGGEGSFGQKGEAQTSVILSEAANGGGVEES